MHNRVKILRKSLKLSQAAFGERLGVSRDVINNIENARVELKELMVKSLCSLFSVNEHWLRTGEGSMLVESDDSLFTAFSEKYGLTQTEQNVARYCLQLTSTQRTEILKHVLNIAEIINPTNLSNEHSSTESVSNTIPQELAKYKQELEAAQRAQLVCENSDLKKNGTK